MMGWLTPHRAGQAGRDHFRGYQCGLCHHLGAEHGLVTRLAAGPDLVAYQAFLDVVGGTEASLVARPCVLNPRGRRGRGLPARAATEHTALAAAFGLWMGVEKARDDWRDEGRVLGWLAARVLAEPASRARRTLTAAGFPVAEVEGWLAHQAEVEGREGVTLDEAMAATRAIGRLSFGFAARHRPELLPAAEAVGDALATWLFWVDGLLDWPRDVAGGRYNPLAASLAGPTPALPTPELRAAALAGADEALLRLSDGLDRATSGGLGAAFLRAVLVHGPRDRLARLSDLAPSPRASARDLLPPRPPRLQRLRTIAARAGARAWRSRVVYRLQAALALALAWAFPSRSWAEEWWPEAPLADGVVPLEGVIVDGSLPDTGVTDTGLTEQLLTDAEPVANGPNVGDACANNWGFCDLDACCADNCCDPVCSGSCDSGCSDSCEPDCGSGCA